MTSAFASDPDFESVVRRAKDVGAQGLELCVFRRDTDRADHVATHLDYENFGLDEKAVANAKRDVDRMMQKAELDAKSKVSESEVLAAARQKSHEIVKRAEERSREMYRVANEYTEDALRRTEEAMAEALSQVRATRGRFTAVYGGSTEEPADEAKSEEKPAEKPAPTFVEIVPDVEE